LACHGEQAEPQATRFPEPCPAGQGEHGHPGRQVEGGLDDLQPDPVLRGVVQGQVPQSRRPGGPDPVLRAVPQPVTSSSSAIGRPGVLVAKQVSRLPSASVILNWAPGCGRSLRTISRMSFGQPSRRSPASSATQAPSLTSPFDSTAGVQADAWGLDPRPGS
jgi:hypothetical protein